MSDAKQWTTWVDGPFLGFDTETTGTDTAQDRIVTAAVVRRSPGEADVATTWLINPGVEIPEAATAVHGITTGVARASGADPAVALEEIAAVVAHAMAEGVPVVVYNAGFDLPLLDAELARHGLPLLGDRHGVECPVVIDPLVIDRWKARYRKGKKRLGDLVEVYGVTPGKSGLHDASVDVAATLDVLQAQIAAYPELGSITLPELHSAQANAHRAWAENFNEWLASKGKHPDVNPEWLAPR